VATAVCIKATCQPLLCYRGEKPTHLEVSTARFEVEARLVGSGARNGSEVGDLFVCSCVCKLVSLRADELQLVVAQNSLDIVVGRRREQRDPLLGLLPSRPWLQISFLCHSKRPSLYASTLIQLCSHSRAFARRWNRSQSRSSASSLQLQKRLTRIKSVKMLQGYSSSGQRLQGMEESYRLIR